MNAPSRYRQWIVGNANGFCAEVINVGARIAKLYVPTKNGRVNVILGYPNVSDYLYDEYYMGALAGRYCNRISKGRFTLNDIIHQLSLNEGDNHFHGGNAGVSKKYWSVSRYNGNELTLTYVSPNKADGYPGELDLSVTFSWEANIFNMEYTALSSEDTIVSLTRNAFFNLSGQEDSALEHDLCIHAPSYTPIDEQLIPTGEIRDVDRTPFDFRKPRPIRSVIRRRSKQLEYGGKGFDHNFVVNPEQDPNKCVAELHSQESGIHMKVYSNQPGLQFYSGQQLSEPFKPSQGISLEPQNFPDAPNKPHFPSAVLRAGEVYKSKIRYEFLTS